LKSEISTVKEGTERVPRKEWKAKIIEKQLSRF